MVYLAIGSSEYKECSFELILLFSIIYILTFLVSVLSLVRQMTMEVMLSTAFGRSVDVQGGKGGELYKAARGALLYFTGQQGISVRLLTFFLRE